MARFMVKASEYKNVCKAVNDRKLAELKKEIIEILKKQDEKEFKKAIDYLNSQELYYTHLEKSIMTGKWVEKAGYGIGTVRTWKGKKYKKVAQGKWVRVFDKEGRGTNVAIGKLISKIQKCDNVEDLMALVMANKSRFVDENGVDLPILDKLRAAADIRNEKLSGESSSYTYGVGENTSREKNEIFAGKDKITKEEADLHKVARKFSQMPTGELNKRKAQLERWIDNKTKSKRDHLNNAIFRESYQKELDAINAVLDKRNGKKETSKPAEIKENSKIERNPFSLKEMSRSLSFNELIPEYEKQKKILKWDLNKKKMQLENEYDFSDISEEKKNQFLAPKYKDLENQYAAAKDNIEYIKNQLKRSTERDGVNNVVEMMKKHGIYDEVMGTEKPAANGMPKDKEYEYYKNNLSIDDDLKTISEDIKKEREYFNNHKEEPGAKQRLKELDAKEKVVNELLNENPDEKKTVDYSKMSEDELNELNKKLRQAVREKDYGEADEEIEQINEISKQKIINSYKTREKHTLQHIEDVEQKKKMIADSKAIVEKDLARKEKQRTKESSIAKKNQMADEIDELKYKISAFEQIAKELDEEKSAEKEDYKIAQSGKLATQKQVDYATEVADKYSLTREEMLKKPITTIQKYANTTVEDFDGGIDKFIEYMAEGRSEGVSLDEVGKEFGKLINHNIARKIWADYESGVLEVNDDGIFEPKKETKKEEKTTENGIDENTKKEALDRIKEYAGKKINSKPIEITKIEDDGKNSGFLTFEFKSGDDTYKMTYDYGFGGEKGGASIKKIESETKEKPDFDVEAYKKSKKKLEDTIADIDKKIQLYDSNPTPNGMRMAQQLENQKKEWQKQLENLEAQKKDYKKSVLGESLLLEGIEEQKEDEEEFLLDNILEEDIDDMEKEKEEESLFNDYTAEEPEEFNSTEFLVREALNRRFNCL